MLLAVLCTCVRVPHINLSGMTDFSQWASGLGQRDFLTCKPGMVTILAKHVGLWEEQWSLTFEDREDDGLSYENFRGSICESANTPRASTSH